MPDFLLQALTDPNFYVGVAAPAIVFLTAFATARRKKLYYDVVLDHEVSPGRREKGVPRIMKRTAAGIFKPTDWRKGKPFRRLCLIEVQNAVGRLFGGLVGGSDITEERVKRPVAFSFGKESRVLSAKVAEESPPDIGAAVRVDASQPGAVSLCPVLLNQGDRVMLEVMIEDPAEEVPKPVLYLGPSRFRSAVNGASRIVGVRRLKQRRSGETLFAYGLFSLLCSESVFQMAHLLAYLRGDQQWFLAGDAPWALGAQLVFTSLSLLLITIASKKVRRSRRLLRQRR